MTPPLAIRYPPPNSVAAETVYGWLSLKRQVSLVRIKSFFAEFGVAKSLREARLFSLL